MKGKHALIIDDDKSIQKLLNFSLKSKYDFDKIHCVDNPLDALKKVCLYENDLSLITLDYELLFCNAPQFYKLLKQGYSDLTSKIMMISGCEDAATFAKKENITFFKKPYDLSELYRTIDERFKNHL